MKHVLLLMSVIVMIASYQSGTLNVVSALSLKDVGEHLHGIDKDQLLRALEPLKITEIDEQWLHGIDKDQLLRALEPLDIVDDGNGINVGLGFMPKLDIKLRSNLPLE